MIGASVNAARTLSSMPTFVCTSNDGVVVAAVDVAVVVAVIDNGMGLLGYAAGIKYIVTGLVLLVSAGVDALSRKGSS